MSNYNIAKEWFKVPETDLASAEFLLKMHPVPLEIICYHCQQAAEKFLKGYLAYQAEPIRKTHDLVLLNNLCAATNPDFLKISDECLELTDYGVNIRYPFPMDIILTDAKAALKKAQKIAETVANSVIVPEE